MADDAGAEPKPMVMVRRHCETHRTTMEENRTGPSNMACQRRGLYTKQQVLDDIEKRTDRIEFGNKVQKRNANKQHYESKHRNAQSKRIQDIQCAYMMRSNRVWWK